MRGKSKWLSLSNHLQNVQTDCEHESMPTIFRKDGVPRLRDYSTKGISSLLTKLTDQGVQYNGSLKHIIAHSHIELFCRC